MLTLLGRAPPVSLLGLLGCSVEAVPAGKPICPLWDLLALHTCAAGDRLNTVQQTRGRKLEGECMWGLQGYGVCEGAEAGCWGHLCRMQAAPLVPHPTMDSGVRSIPGSISPPLRWCFSVTGLSFPSRTISLSGIHFPHLPSQPVISVLWVRFPFPPSMVSPAAVSLAAGVSILWPWFPLLRRSLCSGLFSTHDSFSIQHL